MPTGPCPICHGTVAPREQNPAFPFCSPRCKTIDLGKWLTGEYRIPVVEVEDDGEGEASPAAPSDEEPS